MKLLLDENLSKRLVPFLQHDFPGTTQVVLLGMNAGKYRWQLNFGPLLHLSRRRCASPPAISATPRWKRC